MKEENTRLRQQLEARASGSAPPPSLAHSQSRSTLPSLISQSTPQSHNHQTRPDSSQGGYPPQGPQGGAAHGYGESPFGATERERDDMAKHARDVEDRWGSKGKGRLHLLDR